MKTYKILFYGLLCSMTGCFAVKEDTKGRDARPELFHLRTAAAKALLPGKGMLIEGPSESLCAGQSYSVRIFAENTDSARPVIITSNPADIIGTPEQKPAGGNWWTVPIQADKLTTNLFEVEITALHPDAAKKSLVEAVKEGLYRKRVFKVEAKKKPQSRNSENIEKVTLNVWSFKDTADEFGGTFANLFIAADLTFDNKAEKPALIYGASLTAMVRYSPAVEDVKKVFGDKAVTTPQMLNYLADERGTLGGYFDFKEERRPMSFADVNVIIALLDPDHSFHLRAHEWWKANADKGWASCPLTENGCVRIMSNPGYSQHIRFAPRELISRLQTFAADTDHQFWPDGISLRDETVFATDRIHGGRHLTDIYLLALATNHQGRLATFDASISLSMVKMASVGNLCMV